VRRRGTILITVLVIVTLSSLAATTVLLTTDAETTAAALAVDHDRSRSLARSGLRAVMTELESQRDDLLRGGSPRLKESWTLFTDELGRRGVVRLVDLTPEDPERVAISEPSRLDVNAATPEMLAALPGIDRRLAGRIIGARPFSSVEELVRVDGVTPELLYGRIDGDQAEQTPDAEREAGADNASLEQEPLPEFEPRDDESGGGSVRSSDQGTGGDASTSASVRRGQAERLADLLTVFSFDPNVQMGLVESSARGDLRINLNREWSDRLRRAVANRFDAEAADFLEQLARSGVTFESDADIVAQLIRFAPGQHETWADMLDTFTTTDDQFRPGRVDLNRAAVGVLAALPGIGHDQARELVLAREGLDERTRLDISWPVQRDVLEPEAFQQAINHLTTRSLQWRVRIEVGLVPEQEASEASATIARDVPLERSIVLDAVVDVASQRPRIAYLRNVSMLETARRLATESQRLRDELSAPEDASGPPPDDLRRQFTVAHEGPDLAGTRGGVPGGTDGMPGSGPGAPAGIDGFSGSGDAAPPMDDNGGVGDAPSERPRRRGLERGNARRGAPAEADATERSEPDEPVDRRIGRWTTRQRDGAS